MTSFKEGSPTAFLLMPPAIEQPVMASNACCFINTNSGFIAITFSALMNKEKPAALSAGIYLTVKF